MRPGGVNSGSRKKMWLSRGSGSRNTQGAGRAFPDFVNPLPRYCPARNHPRVVRVRGTGQWRCGFSIGKIRLKRFRLPRMGIRGNLFTAFAVIAAMAIVISAGAALVLRQLGDTMVDLSRPRHPAPRRQPATLGAEREPCEPGTDAAWPRAARNRSSERSKKMKETQTLALQKLGEIIEMGADKTVVTALDRDRQEHRRHDQEPGLGRARAARRRRRCTTSNTTRCARRRPISSPLRRRR